MLNLKIINNLKIYEQNIQETWNTMKRPNLQTIGIVIEEETQITENIFF